MVDLFPIYFLTRSKKASSSDVAPDVEVGGIGSGIIGVNVGDTAGASGAFGLWDNFVLYGGFSTVMWIRVQYCAGVERMGKHNVELSIALIICAIGSAYLVCSVSLNCAPC